MDFQKEIVHPRAKNEIDQHPDAKSYDISPKFEENLQQSPQFLSDQEEELVDFSSLDTREHFQQIVFSFVTEDQSYLHDECHVSSHDFNDDL